ncbi:19821_t:CDS:1, partial [Racocetra persica]
MDWGVIQIRFNTFFFDLIRGSYSMLSYCLHSEDSYLIISGPV